MAEFDSNNCSTDLSSSSKEAAQIAPQKRKLHDYEILSVIPEAQRCLLQWTDLAYRVPLSKEEAGTVDTEMEEI